MRWQLWVCGQSEYKLLEPERNLFGESDKWLLKITFKFYRESERNNMAGSPSLTTSNDNGWNTEKE